MGHQNIPFFCSCSDWLFEPILAHWSKSSPFPGLDGLFKGTKVYKRICSWLCYNDLWVRLWGWGWSKCFHWMKVLVHKKKSSGLFYMTKTAPLWWLASLARHQMYGRESFFSWLLIVAIILAAPKRLCRIMLISLLAELLHLGLSHRSPDTLLIKARQLARTKKTFFFLLAFFFLSFFQFCGKKKERRHRGWQRISFAFREMINWYKRLKTSEKNCEMDLKRGLTGKALFVLGPLFFNELLISGQEKLLCVFSRKK